MVGQDLKSNQTVVQNNVLNDVHAHTNTQLQQYKALSV